MTIDPEPLRDFADRFFCRALKNAENLRDFLMEAVPELAPRFDFSRTTFVDPQLVLPNWHRRQADLLFEIPYRSEGEEELALVCLLIEHQSKLDARMPLRMLLEVALYWDRQWKAWEEKPSPKDEFRLTPVLPIVLHTGPRAWGSARTIADMLGPPAVFHAFAPPWSPVFWELSKHSPDELLNAEQAFLHVLAVVRMEREEFVAFELAFQEAFRKLNALRETSRVRWTEMIELIFGWVLHRRPKSERPLWGDLAAAVQKDEIQKQEVRAMAQLLGKTIVEEAHEDRARHMLLLQGRKRFGEAPPDVLLALQAIEDLDRFDRMSLRLLEVSSWTELLETI